MCKEYAYTLFSFRDVFNRTFINMKYIIRIYKKIISHRTASIFFRRKPTLIVSDARAALSRKLAHTSETSLK